MKSYAYGIFVVVLTMLLISCAPKRYYVLNTELGDITVKVFPKKAPKTVANFERYVERGDFEGATFYRVVRMDNQPQSKVKIEVIQGGFVRSDKSFEPIKLETTEKTGIKHKHGTISMARSKPHTASSAFFICINDQPELDYGGKRNPDGQGFAAFGQVTEGMDVVKKIQHLESKGQMLQSPVIIKSIVKRK